MILISFDSVPARWSHTVEAMVFTLLTRRSSREGCRGKLCFLYQSNKILLQFSWTHFPVNHNKWPSKCPTLTRDAIQYETKCDFSTSCHALEPFPDWYTSTILFLICSWISLDRGMMCCSLSMLHFVRQVLFQWFLDSTGLELGFG